MPAPRDPIIELRGASVVREGRTILSPFDLVIHPGEHTVILGPNGCGKSTLIRLLTREIYPFGGVGHLKICGKERWIQSELRTFVGLVGAEPKEPLVADPTGLELAISGLLGTYGVLDQHEITPEMREQGLAALQLVCRSAEFIPHSDRGIHSVPTLADQKLATMSLGEQRRCWIARALVSKPKLLVLDEPTTGLDLVARASFLKTVESLAPTVTCLLVTHHLEEISDHYRRLVMLKAGQKVFDGPIETGLTSEGLSEVYGASVIVSRASGGYVGTMRA